VGSDRDVEGSVARLIRGTGSFDAQAQADAKEWFEGYFFPAMTTPDLYEEIGELRRRYTRDMQTIKQPPVYDFIVNLLLTNAKQLVEANYAPPTRINAIVLIAELNEGDKGQGAAGFPVPYAPALPYLREKLNDPNQIDGVRLVALAGIHRHVESQWWQSTPLDAALNDGLQREMLSIVTATEPPANRSPDAHTWFRGRAADVLGSLNGWAPTSASFAALSDILADTNASISLRCRAAYALGRFDYTKLQAIDPVDLPTLTGNIGGLLADACKTEVTWLDKKQDELSDGGMFGGPGGGVGGPMSGGAMGGAMMSGMMGGAARRSGGGGARSSTPSGSGSKDDGNSPFDLSGGSGGATTTATGPDTGGLPLYLVDASRRRLLYEIACVRTSVNGPEETFKGLTALAANNPKAQANVEAIGTAVTELVKAIDQKDYNLNEMLKEIRAQMQTLDNLRPQTASEESAVPESDIPTEESPATSDDVPAETTPDSATPPAAEGAAPSDTTGTPPNQ
jgi:hypothetical protein